MNKLLIYRLLGLISLLIGGSMLLSLPWAFPLLGEAREFETAGFFGLLGAMGLCGVVGAALMFYGRKAAGDRLYRREAIAVVGLSWLMATILGALPFWFSGTCGQRDAETGQGVVLDFFDGVFESASGFSGTGATVLTNLEDPELVPRSILFWRSETHFLGGLGIMVLFVAILGLGSAGKTLMLTEMPGPSQESPAARTQRAAWNFAMIFIGLTVLLSVLLRVQGVSWFDALCHAFGTIATGGFSTYNNSVEHFDNVGVEMTIALFMVIACTNFTLLYYLLLMKPAKLLGDVEFRTYIGILAVVTALVIAFGMGSGDFASMGEAVRYGTFQVVSIMTNTGFGSHDFDRWHSFSRGALLLLMFVGGCAGSTSCSVKVIRYILFFKILRLEMEHVFHPTVVRHVQLGGKPVEDPDLRKEVVVYFGMIAAIFVVGSILLVSVEPDSTWVEAHRPEREKLIDCASAVAATLNGVGPGLGIVGESENYAHFHGPSKLVLTALMLLGRLEVFVLLVLFLPRFWRGK
ncbi:MAG: TrkH family potassium uptake protein [Candidatus Nealsonbacteria bacterium]|nr:TrkH family potassium uptake protein [Candidatus Nealsonbacteria bacterium]